MKGIVILLLSCVSSVSVTRCWDRQMETYAVEGQAVRLYCITDDEDMNDTFTYSWTKDNYTLKASPRLLLHGSSLWLLSTVSSDSGHYVCISTNGSISTESSTFLSVKKAQCPRAPVVRVVLEGTFISLACTEDPIETLGQIFQMKWLKDCKATGIQGNTLTFNVSMNSVGNYTCMVIFGYDGQNYTASYTTELEAVYSGPIEKPKVIYPRNLTVHTKPGGKTKLECSVFMGYGKDAIIETEVYWLVNYSFTMDYPQLQVNLTRETRENDQIYGTSTLFISEVLLDFFDVPFKCTILNPNGMDMGVVWLKQEYPYTIQTQLTIALVLSIVVVLGIVLFVFFKVDIILFYRQLCGNSRRQTKIYNAYVFSCHGNAPGSPAVQDLVQRILPEVLEQQHDLKLFIPGRDDANMGENPDMSGVLSQSKTVLLILPGSCSADQQKDETSIPLNPGQDKLDVSHCKDFYSVIAQSSIPVIVVESGENADYSLLPESIQSIIQKGRVLRWSPAVQPSGRFWRHLRYHMT